MNKTIMKILISTLILLIGISAVSAIEQNSTDEFMSVEQIDEISVINDNTSVISINENNNGILSAEDNTTTISISENNSEKLSAEDNTTTISISENNSEKLSAESNTTVISLSNDDDLTTSSPFAQEPQGTQSQTQFKILYLGKMTFLKKYKKMALYGYKIPSKKNKKAWKKHKAYQKAYKKQLKLLKKSATKAIKKAATSHWHPRGDVYYKVKYTRKCIQILFYMDFYRTYNYNALLKKGWWD